MMLKHWLTVDFLLCYYVHDRILASIRNFLFTIHPQIQYLDSKIEKILPHSFGFLVFYHLQYILESINFHSKSPLRLTKDPPSLLCSFITERLGLYFLLNSEELTLERFEDPESFLMLKLLTVEVKSSFTLWRSCFRMSISVSSS